MKGLFAAKVILRPRIAYPPEVGTWGNFSFARSAMRCRIGSKIEFLRIASWKQIGKLCALPSKAKVHKVASSSLCLKMN